MPSVILKPQANFDLMPKNPRPLLIKPESTKVNVEIEIETKAPNSAKTDRWTKVAEGVMQDYRDVVTDTVTKVSAKWDEGGSKSELEKDAKELNLSINNAYRAMEAAIEKAVKEQIKREAQGDKNLLEARVAVAVKGTFKVISIAKDVAEIAVTSGASIKAWLSLGKEIVALGKLIHDQCKDEPALRNDLLKSIGTYCSTKQKRWDEEKKAKDWKAKAKLLAKEIWTSQKSLATKCEGERKKYRNEVTAMIQNVDKLGDKRDKLQKELESSGNVDAKGLATGALKVKLGGKIKDLNGEILKCQEFADDMAMLLTEAGIDVDDSTEMQKLAKLKNVGSVAKAAKDVYDAAMDVQEIIDKITG